MLLNLQKALVQKALPLRQSSCWYVVSEVWWDALHICVFMSTTVLAFLTDASACWSCIPQAPNNS